uniref:D-aminoacyl-tRNA deacylase n=1 Tax=Anopheles funestus TaxID=62324 RepID=A0A182RB60_ANOFN
MGRYLFQSYIFDCKRKHKSAVGDEAVSSIGRGLLHSGSARKLLKLRVFDEPAIGKRQLTLHHQLKGYTDRTFSRSMQGSETKQLYGSLLKQLGEQYNS